MTFEKLITDLRIDTGYSLDLFHPELALCATIVLILLLRIVGLTSWIHSFYVALAGAAVGLYLAAPWQNLDPNLLRQPIFTGMLVYDNFTIYFRGVLLLFAVLFILFTRISGIPDRVAAPDFYVLVLGALLGMCLMASANHLLIVFLSVEMASVPSYVLAGMLKGRRQSSEAALKYAIYGAGTAGIMLYGISLLAGVLGSVELPTMAARLAELLQAGAPIEKQMVLALGALMVMVGLAFKLSAVPFHFWCPDVFEGASAEVDAFLSVASKAAALALLVRVAFGFAWLSPVQPPDLEQKPVARVSAPEDLGPPARLPATTKLVSATQDQQIAQGVAEGEWVNMEVLRDPALSPVRDFLTKLLAFVAVITCTFGNLAAYGQTNIKRLLAYSTIAHAGYMIMPIAAAMALAGSNPEGAHEALAALAFYVAVYVFMNLGAFAIVAFLRNSLRSEEIADYAGLIHRAPMVVVCFSAILFSLVGLPPLAGFSGKLLIFASLVDAKLLTVLVIGGLNTALSLFYYLRVVKVMTIDPEPENRMPVGLSFVPATFVVALTLPVLALGIWWNDLRVWAMTATSHFFS